jgi:hypothetical protein
VKQEISHLWSKFRPALPSLLLCLVKIQWQETDDNVKSALPVRNNDIIYSHRDQVNLIEIAKETICDSVHENCRTVKDATENAASPIRTSNEPP